jgi:lipoprotein-anchoring transpeptidase ErfK/SrfK
VRRFLVPVVVTLVGVALLVAGCGSAGSSDRPVAAPVVAVPAEAPAPTTPPAPPVDTAPADVATVQQVLSDGHYYRGPVDGQASPAYVSALWAFNRVNGQASDHLPTATDLGAATPPVLQGGPADRVEVDLTKQVVYLVKGGQLSAVLPASSGSGAVYKKKSGRSEAAITPIGTFTVQYRIVGVRKAELGVLLNPQYFYQGWAIHGVDVLAPVPDSHGCVQVTKADSEWLLSQIGPGWTVTLYGGTHVFAVPGNRQA